MQGTLFLLLGMFDFNTASISFQSSYSWLDDECICSWSTIKTVSNLDLGEIGCASQCATEEDNNCRGFLNNKETQTCDLFAVSDTFLCLKLPINETDQTRLKVQAFKIKTSKKGLYLVLPQIGKAVPLSNMQLPDLSIPSNPDLMEMMIEYKSGILGCSGNRKCWFWKFGFDEWQPFASPQSNHFLGKMVLLDGKPFLIGGCHSGGISCSIIDKVEAFNESINQWYYEAPLPRPTRSFAAIVVDNGTKVIVAGGKGTTGSTNKVMSFQLATSSWANLNGLPVSMCCQIGSLVTLPDSREGFLIVGGLVGIAYSFSDKAFFMDLDTMSWENLVDFDTTGHNIYDGDMFYLEGQLFVVPSYEGAIRRDATKILSRQLTDSNPQWIAHDISAKFDLGKISRTSFEVEERPIDWISV